MIYVGSFRREREREREREIWRENTRRKRSRFRGFFMLVEITMTGLPTQRRLIGREKNPLANQVTENRQNSVETTLL